LATLERLATLVTTRTAFAQRRSVRLSCRYTVGYRTSRQPQFLAHALSVNSYPLSGFRACRLRSIGIGLLLTRLGRAEQQNEHLHHNRRHRRGHFWGRLFRTAVH